MACNFLNKKKLLFRKILGFSVGDPSVPLSLNQVYPDLVDFPIPSNDDASKSIDVILSYVFGAIEEGLNEREKELKAQKIQSEKKEKETVDSEVNQEETVDQSNKNIKK